MALPELDVVAMLGNGGRRGTHRHK